MKLLEYITSITSSEARTKFISGYGFPAELKRRLIAQRPHLSPSDADRALEGLRQFFLACLRAQRGSISRQLGMPSKVVDEAWHEFILMTRDYEGFCKEAFGKYLHHTPEGQMKVPMRDALANTLHQLRKPMPGAVSWTALGTIPLLFAIDRELGLPDGNRYETREIQDLDARRLWLAANSDGGATALIGSDGSSGHCGDTGAACGDAGAAGGCSGGGCGS